MVNASMAAAGAATTAAICVALLSSAPAAVESRSLSSNLFGVPPSSHHRAMTRNTAPQPLGEALLSSIPRGGDEDEEEEKKPLYLPELVTTLVSKKSSGASGDYAISLSPEKASELSVRSGDVVTVIGRRRRSAYATVTVDKKLSGDSLRVSENMSANLRVRDDDKAKVIKLTGDDEDRHTIEPASAASATLSPVRDSLMTLHALHGGDMDDDSLLERFVRPYLNLDENESVILGKGNVLKLTDDDGAVLEFQVVQLEDGNEEASGE